MIQKCEKCTSELERSIEWTIEYRFLISMVRKQTSFHFIKYRSCYLQMSIVDTRGNSGKISNDTKVGRV